MGALALSFVVLAILVYVPGAMLLYAIGFDRFLSVAFAPIVSCFAYAVFGVAYYQLGVFATWATMVLPFAGVSLVAFIARIIVDSRIDGAKVSGKHSEGHVKQRGRIGSDLEINPRQFVVALAANAFIGGCVFLLTLDGADSFSQGYDMGHHLSHVMTTVQYGNFSTLNSSMYGLTPGAFYPSMFHIIAGLVAGMLGVSSPLAINAEVLVLILLVYPIGCFLLGHQVLKGRLCAGLCTTVLCLCFAGFPWILIRFCSLMANVCTMALLPIALACFMYAIELRVSKRQRIVLAAVLLVSIAVVGIAHPNGVFSAAIFLAPYCVSRICVAVDDNSSADGRNYPKKIAFSALFVIFFLFVWIFLLKTPAFHAVVTYTYGAKSTVSDAIVSVIWQKMRYFSANVPLAILVFAGIIQALRTKGLRWLVASYLYGGVSLIVCMSQSSSQLKFFFSGFWYNHDFRLMAVFALCSLPLAALGLSSLASLAQRLVKRVAKDASLLKREICQVQVCAVAVIVLAVTCVCFPKMIWIDGEVHSLPMLQAIQKIRSVTDLQGDRTALHSEERDFIEKAAKAMPEGSLAMNTPYDGSSFAYGLSALNVYYRTTSTNGRKNDDEILFIGNADKIATSKEVAAAAKRMGIDYVLQLDHGFGESASIRDDFSADEWRLLNSVDGDTPGYEIVLSEGDMRLLRITY